MPIPASQRVFGAPLLEDGDGDDEYDEAEQHQRFVRVAHQQIDGAGAQQQQEHRLPHYLQDRGKQRVRLLGGDLVPAVLRATRSHLRFIQPGLLLRPVHALHPSFSSLRSLARKLR